MSLPVERTNLFYALTGAWIVYLIAGAIYRLYFHPLAKFPGPKVAALTGWYEAYHDMYRRGMFIWKIQEMHEKYGMLCLLQSNYVCRLRLFSTNKYALRIEQCL